MAAPIRVNQRGRPRKEMAPIIAWQRDIGNWVIEFLEQNRRIATGDTINSLVIDVDKDRGESFLLGADSLRWALGGRGPGKFPPVNKIRQWILDKPIALLDISLNSLAFLIGRKIAEEGTGGVRLKTDAITSVINFTATQHLNDLGNIQAEQASQQMVDLLTQLPNTTEK